MSKITWDAVGEHKYENGVDHGVLYALDQATSAGTTWKKGVAWNGLVSVTQSPDGAESNPIYADNIKYLNILSAEDFKATIEAYTYPDEFAECDGSAELAPGSGVYVDQQERKPFCFCYRTKIGNDLSPEAGYKLHIIYNALAAPTERAYETINESPEAATFSWEVSTTPVDVSGLKPTAHITIDSTKCPAGALATIEAALYGDADHEPAVLMPNEILEIIQGSHTKLDAPVLAADDANASLNITVDAASEAESFDIYEGSAFVKNVAKTGTTTVATYASLGYSTAGSHYLKAKAQGGSHLDSDFSNRVKITVAE